ncbi:autotransporter-associated beta strand repeat-containing protein [Fontivita pretiosa]|uniref:beta strand repeat-containing protein n=1 Tax=Fontivita pretiosa TaxID=2989684 RepID=UPI003D167197
MSPAKRAGVLSAAAFGACAGWAMHPAAAPAAAFTWIATTSGNWSTPANWSAAAVPVSAGDTLLRFTPTGGTQFDAFNDVASPFTLNILWFTNNSTQNQTISGGPLRFVPIPGVQQETISWQVPSGTASFGSLTIANDVILSNDLLVIGARIPMTFAGAISGSGRLSATFGGTINLTGANSYAGGTSIAFSTVRANGISNMGTGSVTIGGNEVPINWFGRAWFGSAANVASGPGSVHVGGNGFVQFDQLDAAALATVDPGSRGIVAIDTATTISPVLDMSGHPRMRIGTYVGTSTPTNVPLNATIIPANNTYRFGGTDPSGTDTIAADALVVQSLLGDGPQPRAVNIGNDYIGRGGKVRLVNPLNSYSGGTIVDRSPTFGDLTTGLSFDYTPAPAETPLGSGSLTVHGSLIFEGTFGAVGSLPNAINFRPGSKLLFNNAITTSLPGGGTAHTPVPLDRWGDTKAIDLNGTELTLRALNSHKETVGTLSFTEGNYIYLDRISTSGTVELAMASLKRSPGGRGTLQIEGLGATTIGTTHKVSVANSISIVPDPSTGMVHPSVVADRPGDTFFSPGEFLQVGPGGTLLTSAYAGTFSAALDNEIAAPGSGYFHTGDETVWALRTGASTFSAGSTLRIRSGGLILYGSLNNPTGTLLFDNMGLPTEGIVYVGNGPGSGNGTINASIAGSGGLTKFGEGTLTLTGNNTFTGPVHVNDGTLRAGTAGALGTPTNPVFVGLHGTLDLNGQNLTLSSLTGSGGVTSTLTGTTTLTIDAAGDLRFDGRIFSTTSRLVALNKTGDATLTLGGFNRYLGLTDVQNGTLNLAGRNLGVSTTISGVVALLYGDYNTVLGGAIRVTTDHRIGALGGTGVTYVGDGAELIAKSVRQHMLKIEAGGVTTILPNGTDAATSRLDILAIDERSPGAKLDLNDNDLVVNTGSLTNLTRVLKAGLENGGAFDWRGKGIASSKASDRNRDAGSFLYALGIIANDLSQVGGSGPIYTSFSGETLSGNELLVKFTYFGDADLSGTIDATDYSLIDNGYVNSLTGWINGDFDYSGVIDATDYALIDNAYVNQSGALAEALIAGHSRMFGGEYPAALRAIQSGVIPEGGAGGLVIAGLLAAGADPRSRDRRIRRPIQSPLR